MFNTTVSQFGFFLRGVLYKYVDIILYDNSHHSTLEPFRVTAGSAKSIAGSPLL
jgi:hypothetical protein